MKPHRLLNILLILLCLVLLAACGGGHKATKSDKNPSGKVKNTSYTIGGKTYKPFSVEAAKSYSEVGMASWYGSEMYHKGKVTANGEKFDQNQLTAAHCLLPLPAYVLVTNLENGRSVVVRVNDRGPFKSDRIIDVSRAAAKELGFLDKGTARVKVEFLRYE